MFGNVLVAVRALRIAKANGAPAQHKQNPNELAGKDRHHLTPEILTMCWCSALASVIAGLDTASRVYPTCGTLLMCGPRASPRSDAIHLVSQEDLNLEGDGSPELGYTRVRAPQVRKSSKLDLRRQARG